MHAPKPCPYIGIAGFMTPEEVRAVAADAYAISGFGTPLYAGRKLAVGVLASWKTLNGEAPGRPTRYPKIEDVAAIFEAAATPHVHGNSTFDLKERCLRLIHYNTKEPNLTAQLDRLCEIAGPHLDGFQLNTVWPPEDELRAWAEEHPAMRIVLQVNRKMFANVGGRPQLLAEEIGKKYVPGVTDLLFDLSGGEGRTIDFAEAGAVLETLYARFGGGLNIGLAGGLDWQSVGDLAPLFGRWPDLSIDAEGRLRDPKTDALNCELAREFPRRALGLLPRT